MIRSDRDPRWLATWLIAICWCHSVAALASEWTNLPAEVVPPIASDQQITPAPVEVIQERFTDGTVKIQREVTQDAGHNYVNHGVWKQWDRSGRLIAEGRYEMGQPVGTWRRRYEAGSAALFETEPFAGFTAPFESKATFRDGLLEGEWTIYDAEQRRCCLVTLTAGKRDGRTAFWRPDGEVWQEMSYRQGLLDGDILELNADGDMEVKATYLRGRERASRSTEGQVGTSPWSEADFLTLRLEPIMADDFMSAQFATYRITQLNQRHGRWRSWYPSGQQQVEGEYHEDQPTGKFVWWHANGQKAVEGEYHAGRQAGRWVWWHANGQKAAEGHFDGGNQVGEWWGWRPDGQLEHHLVHETTGQGTAVGVADRRSDATRLPPVQ